MRAGAVRWGVLGTPNILRAQLLPALADGDRAVLEDPAVDAHSFAPALRHIAAALRGAGAGGDR